MNYSVILVTAILIFIYMIFSAIFIYLSTNVKFARIIPATFSQAIITTFGLLIIAAIVSTLIGYLNGIGSILGVILAFPANTVLFMKVYGIKWNKALVLWVVQYILHITFWLLLMILI